MEEKQKVYLDLYSVLQEYAHKKPGDILFAGLKDEFKTLIGHGINLLTAALGVTTSFIDLFLKPLVKATITELMIKCLKQPNPKFKTYTDFKANFMQFIGEEQKRLGADFEKRYPLFGFEEWIE